MQSLVSALCFCALGSSALCFAPAARAEEPPSTSPTDVERALLAPPTLEEPATPTVSVSALVESGAPELVLSGATYGGVAGFLTSATLLSLTRVSQLDSLPWLIGTPALGILAGGAAAAVAAYSLELDAGDAALVSSTPWIGTGWGIALQLVLFDQRDDVGHIPLRFVTVLGSGLGLGAVGVLSAWALDVDPGDVGLMNSAALWGPVLVGLGWASLAGPFGGEDSVFTNLPALVTTLLLSSVVPFTAVLAAHPLLDIARPATWLIEAGGAAGLLGGFALLAFLGSAPLPTSNLGAVLTATTALGVGGGVALAFVLSDAAAALDLSGLTGRLFSLAPAILPPAPGRAELAPGLFATLRF